MAVEAYEYTAITAPKTIRLIHISPGIETDPVRFSLETSPLESAPDFEAISYCWGTDQDQHQVVCNGKPLLMHKSLFGGLSYFRFPDKTRVLWADAVCINQADPVEKSSQVLLMPHIYSQATRVLVWLGAATDPVFGSVPSHTNQTILQGLQMLPSFDPENAAEMAAKTQAISYDALRLRAEDHDWAPLVALLRRPWFRRKWVVQEVALAKEARLYVGGGVEIEWLDIARLAFGMESLGLDKPWRLKLENPRLDSDDEKLDPGKGSTVEFRPVYITFHLISSMYMVQIYRHHATLVDGVMTTKFFDCTDPRDHVFSLLGLGAGGPTIRPDYEASVSEVFRRFSISMVIEGNSLKLLSLAPDRALFQSPEVQRLEDLPTWVPDLRLMRADVMASFTVRPQGFFAGGNGKPVLSVSGDERLLHCQGLLLDSPRRFATPLVEMLLEDIPEFRNSWETTGDPSPERRERRFIRWLRSAYQTAFGHDRACDLESEAVDSFSRTMSCGTDFLRNRLSPEQIATIWNFIQWKLGPDANKDEATERDSTIKLNYATTTRDSLLLLTLGAKFCVTESGRFGQVPLNSKLGDRICVLTGGEVPFVVRPTGSGTYTLIGECYIDGIMDGEALQEASARGMPLETIILE
uniref:Heterokaryon incompatibility domain-containing protein n=2 Tax=Bionectria ochroleuca TaxID=29856 RepID=A0A0B7K0G7_BIOOC